jgi:hypothetical protein
MGTEPALQEIAVRLYQAGKRDADLEFEMGARAMTARDFDEAARHLALVTDGERAGQARLLRTLALGILGRVPEARQELASAGSASTDATSARWLAGFVEWKAARLGATQPEQKAPSVAHP